jgi:hypothetical protein
MFLTVVLHEQYKYHQHSQVHLPFSPQFKTNTIFRKQLLPKLLFGLNFGDNVYVIVSAGDIITDLHVLTIRINLKCILYFLGHC